LPGFPAARIQPHFRLTALIENSLFQTVLEAGPIRRMGGHGRAGVGKLRKRLGCKLIAFGRGSDGSATIEFVLWIPLIFSIMLMGADATLLFVRQADFVNASRDTARLLSRHALTTEGAIRFAQSRAGFAGRVPDVAVDVDPAANTVTVTVSSAAAAMDPLGVLRFALGNRIQAQTTYMFEPI
jgi:Flp pilus assembly protein TadG